MGFLDKIKKAFDTGGISADLNAPREFRWSDETLPLSLTLTGHDTEVRTVKSVTFRLQETADESRSKTAREREHDGIRFKHNESFDLQPGETVSIDIAFPLTTSEILERVDAMDNAPGWLATAAKVVDAGAKLSTTSDDYTISASPEIEGAKMAKSVKRRIRQAGFGDLNIG